MEEKLVKTHLIVTDIENDYNIKWIKTIKETRPMFKNGRLVFVVVGGKGRMEVNTNDMTRVEKSARTMSYPKGRTAVTSDVVRILLKQEDESEVLMGLLTHNRVKTFAPMFDKIWVQYYGDMAELADASDLSSDGQSRVGSSPTVPTAIRNLESRQDREQQCS